MLGDLNNLIIVKIQTRNRIIGFWLCRFFLDRQCFTLFIKLDHTEARGITYR